MAMSKKPSRKIAISTVAVLIIVGAQYVLLADANPVWMFFLPPTPVTDKPIVSIQSPSNYTIYNSTSAQLNFTVTKPDSWFGVNFTWADSIKFHGTDSSENYVPQGAEKDEGVGTIEWVKYSLDGQNESTIYVPLKTLDPKSYVAPPGYLSPPETMKSKEVVFSINLTELSEGKHTLTVRARGKTTYLPDNEDPYISDKIDVDSNPETVIFRIGGHPINASIASPENKIYDVSEIPLSFVLAQDTSWIGYRLDDHDNITVLGDTVLTGLDCGYHTLVLYANDTFGVMTASKINFTVAPQQTPTPITSPQTPMHSIGFLGTNLPTEYGYAIMAVLVIIVVAGLSLIYFKKRK